MLLPSKKLFKEVMGIDLTKTYFFGGVETERKLWIDGNYIIWDSIPYTDEISIFEFAFKTKEWNRNNLGEVIYYVGHSGLYGKGFCFVFTDEERVNDCAYIKKEFWADTEVEAIIKAGEYILQLLGYKK